MRVALHNSFMAFLAISLILAIAVGVVLAGCGEVNGGSGTTAAATSSTTTPGPTFYTTLPEDGMASSGTSEEGSSPETAPGIVPTVNGPTTTVFTGTTLPYEFQTRTLRYIGPMTEETWQTLRDMVNASGGDGESVLDKVSTLAAGPSVEVPASDLDAVGGIGFSAGASTGQAIAIAVDDDGDQIMVFAYTVIGKPSATTIVGYERRTRQVKLVEGPLPITNSTQNITTVPLPE